MAGSLYVTHGCFLVELGSLFMNQSPCTSPSKRGLRMSSSSGARVIEYDVPAFYSVEATVLNSVNSTHLL